MTASSSIPPAASARTRHRLLCAAVARFAEHGYHSTSTRDICRDAGVNSAAIHYHFGDKANLYREVFRYQIGPEPDASLALTTLPRREALVAFYRALLVPLAGTALHQQLMRLHAREEVEPSGVLGAALEGALGSRHEHLTAFLVRELGLRAADVEVERLAFALAGMASTFQHLRDLVAGRAPDVAAGPAWVELTAARLADYAVALIGVEAARRAPAAAEVAA